MKTIFLFLLTLLVANVSAAKAESSSYSFKKLSRSLCEITLQDQVVKFRIELRKAKAHIRNIYPKIKCDGESLLSLAATNQSDSIVEYLKLRAKPELLQEGQQLVSRK